jgi:probable addiction module antidote protein
MSEMSLESFDDLIVDNMRDPEYAVAYLQDALDESIEDFLRALGKYVKANGGIAKCSENAGISREALYRMLSETGNPEFRSIMSVLKACRLHLSIERSEYELACA